MDSKLFQTVGFANCTDYQCENGLPGFYWELVYFNDGRKWKFDIWYTAEKDIKTIEKTHVILQRLKERPEARERILALKEKLFDDDTYIDNMNGFKIYEEVLGTI